MSLVIAIRDKDRIVLGADKQGSIGGIKEHTCTKVWPLPELPGAIMGGVGSARALQVVQYSSLIDKNLFDQDITIDLIICSVAPAIAASLKSNGFVIDPKDDDVCEMLPGSFIFAYKDKCWLIWSDLSVTELEDYLAIGSGNEVARGALFATKDKNPFERIVIAIDAAAESTLFVDDNIDLLTTELKAEDAIEINQALGLEIEAEEKELKKAKKKAKKEKK